MRGGQNPLRGLEAPSRTASSLPHPSKRVCLGQLFEQPVRPGQRHAPLPGPGHQLLGELLLGGRHLSLLLPRHVIQCRGHHGTFPAGPSRPAWSGPETPLDPQSRRYFRRREDAACVQGGGADRCSRGGRPRGGFPCRPPRVYGGVGGPSLSTLVCPRLAGAVPPGRGRMCLGACWRAAAAWRASREWGHHADWDRAR
jgi:hypothetical protein